MLMEMMMVINIHKDHFWSIGPWKSDNHKNDNTQGKEFLGLS